MKVLITGTSRGIGKASAEKFLSAGHQVYGLDVKDSAIENSAYHHFICDVSDSKSLPQIDDVEILVNNAGIQTASKSLNADNSAIRDIEVNLLGAINVSEKYAFQNSIKSVLFNASVSALNGNEFPSYVASKAGLVGYMKHAAIRLANEYKATCNALCFGGVMTELNQPVMQDKALWKKIMDVTPLKKWASVEEAAEWVYFMTAVNTFCTGQAIDISGGERNCLDLFVWE
ncbi:MAG: SDR family oxidoreductase [Treponemataceae bacterium]|nr:SDR family oxidoreductase [Treponemataceae bacterium]